MLSVGIRVGHARGLPPSENPKDSERYFIAKDKQTGQLVYSAMEKNAEFLTWNADTKLTVPLESSVIMEIHEKHSGRDWIVASREFPVDEMRMNFNALRWYKMDCYENGGYHVAIQCSFSVVELNQKTFPRGVPRAPVDPREIFIYVPTYWTGLSYLTPMEVDVIDSHHLRLKNGVTIPKATPFIKPEPIEVKEHCTSVKFENPEPMKTDVMEEKHKVRFAAVEIISSPQE